jgi:hypothetical protein
MERTSKDFSLGFGHFGNGLSVWNRLKYEHGDYENVAHIAPDRSVKFYKADLPDEVVGQIYYMAISSTATISATQDAPVFSAPPLADELVDATFISLWNDGEISAESKCKVNLKTKEVLEIELSGVDGDLDNLDEERIEFANGEVHPVYPKDMALKSEFWYR